MPDPTQDALCDPAGPDPALEAVADRGGFSFVKRFDLPLRTPAARMAWIHDKDIGITLAADRLAWSIEGKAFEMPLSRISEIHLSTSTIGAGIIPVCALTFDDRSRLKIFGTADTGLADTGQARIYRDFVLELLRSLSADDRRRIAFSSGYTRGRYIRYQIAAYIVLVWLVIMPFGLVLYTQQLKLLIILIFGAGLFWRTRATANANAPRAFDPGSVPGDMIGPWEKAT
jgi:hypothetical protein